MSRLECVVNCWQTEAILLNHARRNCLRVAEALSVSTAEDILTDSQFVSGQLWLVSVGGWVDIDDLDNEVCICAGRLSKEISNRRTFYSHLLLQHRRLIAQDVGTSRHRTL